MNLYSIEWKASLQGAGWLIRAPNVSEVREFLFSHLRLYRAYRNLRTEGVETRFNNLVSQGRFMSWWDQTCGGDVEVEKTFLLQQFPKNIWNIPWELLIKGLDTYRRRATVCFVRTSGQVGPNPSQFDEPLRILILQGDDGRSFNRQLDLNRESKQIMEAYEKVEGSFRECIARPEIALVSLDNLTPLIKEHKPHILWFSGHGNSDPAKTLCLNGPSWISAKDFAESVHASGHVPVYVAFWACETGNVRLDKRSIGFPDIPALCKELSRIGVISILAMQARITDAGARLMASDLLRFMAVGNSLEMAVARTRANMIESHREDINPFDWACPVVWSSGRIVDGLTWNSRAQPLAQLQLMGRQVIRATLRRGGQIDSPPDQNEFLVANRMQGYRRIWIESRENLENAIQQYQWVRTLQALQGQTHLGLLAIDLNDNKLNPEAALQGWAAKIVARLLKGDLDDDIANALYEIKEGSVISGWGHLCSLLKEDPLKFYLAVSGPPKYEPTDWFWQPLLEAISTDEAFVIILSDKVPSDNYRTEHGWQLEKIIPEMNDETLFAILNEQPRLLRALAVLNTPIRTDIIEAAGLPLTQWAHREQVMINTGNGPILSAGIRDFVLDQMNPDETKLAHEDCLRILAHPQIDLDISVREMRVEHCAKAGLSQSAIKEIIPLFRTFHREDLPYSIITLLQRTELDPFTLPSWLLLYLAWAYMRLGQTQEAEIYLEETILQDPLDIAWKNQIQSEINKSTGDKQGALDRINAAVMACEKALTDPEAKKADLGLLQLKLWGYRQDRARIKQYLFYEKEEARTEYEALLDNKPEEDYPGIEIDIAIVQRNYAECLRTLANNSRDPLFTKASEVLSQAKSNLYGKEYAPIYSEVLYEQAKMAEYEGRAGVAATYLVECRRAAIKSRHFMLAAIANCRIFWKTEQFQLGHWIRLEDEIGRFPYHGWAVRVHLSGRVRAAHQLQLAGDLTNGLAQLGDNLRDLESYPAFNQGSDRFRIAATYAGLQVLNDKISTHTRYWEEFVEKYEWAVDWLAEQNLVSAENVWAEVR